MDLALERQATAQRGKRIEYLTIAWNIFEGLASLVAGIASGSVSLIGFGIDSAIEVASALALAWRMSVDADVRSRERNEQIALRLVGLCFLGLAGYIAFESISSLLHRKGPERSIPGIVLMCAALLVMPLLSRAKKQIGRKLGSRAMEADAKQADFCAYLAAIALGGLFLQAIFSWWWADAAAALLMTPLIAREGTEAWRGKVCACH